MFLNATTGLSSRRMHRSNSPKAEQPMCCSLLPATGRACRRAQPESVFSVSCPGTVAESRGQSHLSPKWAPMLAVGRSKEKPLRLCCADLPARSNRLHGSRWSSGPRCSLNVNSTRSLHFEVIVNLLNLARSNHTTTYPLDNEQRLFSFLVPQQNGSFLPASDCGCD